MKRSQPLKRRTPVRRKRKEPRRSGRVRDTEFMLWVKSLECLLRGRYDHECSPAVEAHHAGRRHGMSTKADDRSCIPLCSKAHRELHSLSGAFAGFDKEGLRAWQDLAISEIQSRGRRAGVLAEEDA